MRRVGRRLGQAHQRSAHGDAAKRQRVPPGGGIEAVAAMEVLHQAAGVSAGDAERGVEIDHRRTGGEPRPIASDEDDMRTVSAERSGDCQTLALSA